MEMAETRGQMTGQSKDCQTIYQIKLVDVITNRKLKCHGYHRERTPELMFRF